MSQFRSVVLVLGLCLGWLTPLPSYSQPKDRPADNPITAQISDALDKVSGKKWLDAIEEFQRILDTSGDELVPVDGRQFSPARWVVHGHLSRLPSEALKLYQPRIDAQASKRLDEANTDDKRLMSLLAEMYCSRASERAILILARNHLERGEFDQAEFFWKMLLPATNSDDPILGFPNPQIDPAAIRARLILVKLFREQRAEAIVELREFREKYPQSTGLLAGQNGKYLDTLTQLLTHPEQTTLASALEPSNWSTFAGSAERTGTIHANLPLDWPNRPTWKTPLPMMRYPQGDEQASDQHQPRALLSYPILVDGQALLSDGETVFTVNLTSGKVAPVATPNSGVASLIPSKLGIRHTLSEANGQIFVRMGQPTLKPLEKENQPTSFIVALDKPTAGKTERNILWQLAPPPGIAEATTLFEGSPIVQRGRMYTAYWRSSGGEALVGLACYRRLDGRDGPEILWQRIVGKAAGEPSGEPRVRHDLVSISGNQLVFCTNNGIVVALDLETGKPAWEYHYPKTESPVARRYRDLTPPLCDGNRIYVAPADSNRLLCLDRFDGRLIWESEGIEVIHLLGVAQGRLIATVGGSVRGIRGLNIYNGADSGETGWTIHDDGGETTFGRGLVSNHAVLWPTKHGLHFLRPADGVPLRQPLPGAFGNLCYANGHLVVTTATEIWGFTGESSKRAR